MLSKSLFLKSILHVLDAPKKSIQISAKMVMSQLLLIMDDSDKAHLKLTADEVTHLINLLTIASREGEAEEGVLTCTIAEILTSLTDLSSLPWNKALIIESEILEPLEHLIVNEDYKVQEKSLCLIWNLLSNSSLSDHIFISHRDLCLMLRYIGESPSINASIVAQSILRMIFWDNHEGRNFIPKTN